MKKNILIEDIQRMRKMMGLNENFKPKFLLNEGPGDLYKLLKAFMNASDAGRAAIIKNMEATQKVEFFNLVKKYLPGDASTIKNLDELTLAVRATQLTDLAQSLANNFNAVIGDLGKVTDFATSYKELNKLKTSPRGSKHDQILNVLRSSDPTTDDLLRKLENKDLGNIDSADIQTAMGNLQTLKLGETDPDLIDIYTKLEDDFSKAFQDVREVNDAFYDATSIDFSKIGSDLDLGAYEAAEYLKKTDPELEAYVNNIREIRKTNKTRPLGRESIYALEAAHTRGLITLDEYFQLATSQNATTWKQRFAYAKEFQDKWRGTKKDGLTNLYNAKKNKYLIDEKVSNINELSDEARADLGQLKAIIDDNFEAWLNAKGLTDEKYRNFTSQYPGFTLKTFGSENIGKILDTLDNFYNPFRKGLDAKESGARIRRIVLSVLGVGFGAYLQIVYDLFTIFATYLSEAIGTSVILDKNYIVEWSTEYRDVVQINGTEIDVCSEYDYDWCQLGIPEENIEILDESIQLFFVKNQILKDSDVPNIYKFERNQFADGPIDVFYGNKVYEIEEGSLNELSDGVKRKINEIFNKNNIARISKNIDRFNIEGSSTPTKGTYTQDLKGFLAWCKTKNYTDCTAVGGKWEYKDTQGQPQQARFKDATVGWE